MRLSEEENSENGVHGLEFSLDLWDEASDSGSPKNLKQSKEKEIYLHVDMM